MYWLLALILLLFSGPSAWAANDPGGLESESKSWVGEFMQGVGRGVWKQVDGIGQSIGETWNTAKAFFSAIWDDLLWFFTQAFDTIDGIWLWLCKAVTEWYDWIYKSLVTIWERCVDVLIYVWDTFLELLWWLGDTLLDYLLAFLDWLVSIPYNIFLWLLDQIPQLVFPQGFADGLRLFREYGLLLDKILPMHELFVLLIFYVTFLIFFTVARWLLAVAKFIRG